MSRRRRTTTEPIDRTLLAKLAAGPPGMHMSGLIIPAELDQWAAKLEAEPSKYKKGRIIMQEFIPWMTERLNESTRRKNRYCDGIAPSTN
jgi:hypothetical protein